jgi:hypothetical protein
MVLPRTGIFYGYMELPQMQSESISLYVQSKLNSWQTLYNDRRVEIIWAFATRNQHVGMEANEVLTSFKLQRTVIV